jgi:hypothetical protein
MKTDLQGTGVATATAKRDNVWVIDATEAADEIEGPLPPGEEEASSEYDISGGEWEPTAMRMRRKIAALAKKLF